MKTEVENANRTEKREEEMPHNLSDADNRLKSEIEKRKLAEEALKAFAERFQQVAENAEEFIWEVDVEGLYTYASPVVEKVLGYKPDQIVGKKRFYDLFHPEGREELKKKALRGFAGKKPFKEFINRNIDKEGKTVWLSTSGVPVFDAAGNFTGYRGADTNISKRILAVKALKESEERFRTLIETMSDGLMVLDKNRLITYVNARTQEILGYSVDELLDHHVNDFLDESNRRIMDNQLDTRREGNRGCYEICWSKKNGNKVVTLTSGAPMFDSEGRFSGSFGVITDISERKAAEKEIVRLNQELEDRVEARTKELRAAIEQLVKEIDDRRHAETALIKAKEIAVAANRAKSEFLASMNHELRTPLNAVIGFAEVLEDKHFGPLTEKQAEYTGHILESGRHLLALINDILDLSTLESEKIQLELSSFSIREMLEDSIVLIKETAYRHGIRLFLDMGSGLETMNGDEKRIRQVMFNLLSNAVKFTPDGGEVRISVNPIHAAALNNNSDSRYDDFEHLHPKSGRLNYSGPNFEVDGNWIEFFVEDTGIGIAAAENEKIFDEFYQAKGGTAGKTPGTGLGLSLARRLVEIHGGKIWVESPGKDRGSKFVFILPSITRVDKEDFPDVKIEPQGNDVILNHLIRFIDLSKRQGRNFVLCRLSLNSKISNENSREFEKIIEKEKRSYDFLGIDGQGNVHIILQETVKQKGREIGGRLAKKLGNELGIQRPLYSLAEYPEDGESPGALMRRVTELTGSVLSRV